VAAPSRTRHGIYAENANMRGEGLLADGNRKGNKGIEKHGGSGNLLKIRNHGNFSGAWFGNRLHDFLKLAGHFIAVRTFAALGTNLRRHIFNNDNAVVKLGHKCSQFVFYGALTHKTSHNCSFLVLRSSSHLKGLGMYAVMIHKRFSPLPHTRYVPAKLKPKTRKRIVFWILLNYFAMR